MNKIVVPVDFSDTSRNAANYAIQLAKDIPGCGLTLYYVFDKIAAGSDGTPLYNDEEARKTIAIAALSNLKSNLEQSERIPIICMAEPGGLVENLEKLVKDNDVDMIIMGINGATRLEQLLIGSSTLGVINRSSCPVIIVPPKAIYRGIQVVVFASDLKNVDLTTPIAGLKKIFKWFRPRLYVVHAQNDSGAELNEETEKERIALIKMLQEYDPEFALIPIEDFAESIDQYALNQKADLVITVPRKHSFLKSLFKSSHTKKLAYHTHMPILALHE